MQQDFGSVSFEISLKATWWYTRQPRHVMHNCKYCHIQRMHSLVAFWCVQTYRMLVTFLSQRRNLTLYRQSVHELAKDFVHGYMMSNKTLWVKHFLGVNSKWKLCKEAL